MLRKRADFLRAARAGRAHTDAFTLQARRRSDDSAAGLVRVGYTCSKKVGNAVARNRAKRRLRAVAAQILPDKGRPGWDYVLIGRPGVTGSHPFAAMLADLERALEKVHQPRKPRP
ncbi:ribonuclease P protein component [Mangrovicoccus sp. HB182678]|uniref:Ribonuclease P protein component n=1 Tax=Mangrovicoccus algicola TaxID=2771008 RepID=A0A8J7CMC3_9RHOB|nr:ribonuclease P protein component [Mangrovicoccus algicola]